jgi:MarR family transcriptional regulator for hemolysin
MEEPLTQLLNLVTKKYSTELSKSLAQLSIDKYHYVLVLIHEYDGNLSQKALAELLHIDKSYMVTIINYLEDRGYVIRKKNQKDRREQLISLTANARIDIPLIKDAINELNNKSLKNISESKKLIFDEVLHNMQDNLQDLAVQEPHLIL